VHSQARAAAEERSSRGKKNKRNSVSKAFWNPPRTLRSRCVPEKSNRACEKKKGGKARVGETDTAELKKKNSIAARRTGRDALGGNGTSEGRDKRPIETSSPCKKETPLFEKELAVTVANGGVKMKALSERKGRRASPPAAEDPGENQTRSEGKKDGKRKNTELLQEMQLWRDLARPAMRNTCLARGQETREKWHRRNSDKSWGEGHKGGRYILRRSLLETGEAI